MYINMKIPNHENDKSHNITTCGADHVAFSNALRPASHPNMRFSMVRTLPTVTGPAYPPHHRVVPENQAHTETQQLGVSLFRARHRSGCQSFRKW